jgi:hypothetical protein
MADGESLEITTALTTAQDAEYSNQKQAPGRDADPTSHPWFGDDPQKADQVKIGCGSLRFKQGFEPFPPRTTQAGGSGQDDWG